MDKKLSLMTDRNSKFSCYDFLDRLEVEIKNKLESKTTRFSIFRILSEVADDLSKQRGPRLPLEFDTFMRIEVISAKLLSVTESSERLSVILDVIENGLAFSWIMYFVRSMMIDHGVINIGDQTGSKWLRDLEINNMREKSLERISIDSDKILVSSNPRHILYLWYDLGNPNERNRLSNWVEKQIETIYGLIEFLTAFISIRTSERGQTQFIQTKFLEKVINLEKVITRLEEVPSKNVDAKEQARTVLQRLHASIH